MAKIRNIPNHHSTKLVDFQRLDGGLNLWELDYRLDSNQSPEMKNLWWQDGVLQCRDGQAYLYGPEILQDPETKVYYEDPDWKDIGTGYTCFESLFWDHAFYHIGDKIYYMDMVSGDEEDRRELVELVSGVPENRGTFFRYDANLFYKNRGGFYKIGYDPEKTPVFTVSNLAEDAYSPVIILNASPATGSGSLYQPENRLSPKKTVKYNAMEETTLVTKTTGSTSDTKTFDMGKTAANDFLTGLDSVYFGSTLVNDALYSIDTATGVVTFTTAVPASTTVTFVLTIGVVSYKLPLSLKRKEDEEGEDGSVVKVVVDGKELKQGTDYAVNENLDTVVFVTPPPVHDPPVNNTVEITYSFDNPDAQNAILDCPYATVYGGSQNVCIVLGGCESQPNAFFWNGNDSVGMNESYWPMSFYQLAGDAEDGVTGFGIQYGTLMVLKERSMGKAGFGIEDLDNRDSISLTYTEINNRIGCDLPWTIQLVENNIVFCNTSGGVHIIRDSNAALENNVECISRNVNGTPQRPGLLVDVREAGKDLVCCFDDDNRYWVCANGHVYLWDYLLSTWKDPSWFYFTDVSGIAYLRNVDKSYHLNPAGRVTRFARVFADYNKAIEKVYQFPPQFFDTYDRLKDILHCIFTVRSDTDSIVKIQYQTDYEEREDLTDIESRSWHLVPRNLNYRCLSVQKFALVARRKPACWHVKHFAVRLSNNELAQDLAILSAQIYFRYSGRDR